MLSHFLITFSSLTGWTAGLQLRNADKLQQKATTKSRHIHTTDYRATSLLLNVYRYNLFHGILHMSIICLQICKMIRRERYSWCSGAFTFYRVLVQSCRLVFHLVLLYYATEISPGVLYSCYRNFTYSLCIRSTRFTSFLCIRSTRDLLCLCVFVTREFHLSLCSDAIRVSSDLCIFFA